MRIQFTLQLHVDPAVALRIAGLLEQVANAVAANDELKNEVIGILSGIQNESNIINYTTCTVTI